MKEVHMKCGCCGEEISTSDKFCKYCGEENEIYNILYEEQAEDDEIDNVTSDLSDDEYDDVDEYDDSDTEYVEINGEKTKVVYVEKEGRVLAICALVFCALGSLWIGSILSIIGLCILGEEKNVRKCKIGLGLSVMWVMIWMVIFAIIFSVPAN